MRFYNFSVCIILAVMGMSVVQAAQPVNPDSTGLSKMSVFDTPTPKVYTYQGGQPGQNKILPRAYLNAPPQVPHDIKDFLPITAQNNMCVACHNQPGQWDTKRVKGVPTPMPRSHYTDLRNAPGKVTDQMINGRFNCNQCHVPQTNAKPLVKNTF